MFIPSFRRAAAIDRLFAGSRAYPAPNAASAGASFRHASFHCRAASGDVNLNAGFAVNGSV